MWQVARIVRVAAAAAAAAAAVKPNRVSCFVKKEDIYLCKYLLLSMYYFLP